MYLKKKKTVYNKNSVYRKRLTDYAYKTFEK